MRRAWLISLFIAIFFSFLSCQTEDSSSSVSISVLLPSEPALHGYQNSDLVSCRIELFTSDGAAHIYPGNFNYPVNISSLKSGSFVVRAYGYDAFGTAIALTSLENFKTEDQTQSLQLVWNESGKEDDEFCYVKFDTDGGSSIKVQKIKSGSSLSRPAVPQRANSSFVGWYWNSLRTYEFDFGEPVSCSLTLHAKWIELEVPDSHDEPENPDQPENPDTPDEPENPDQPENPDEPENPDQPENPDTPDEPENPDQPEKPDEPDEPENPDQPENPDTPDDPENPDQPENPDEPLENQGSLSGITVNLESLGGDENLDLKLTGSTFSAKSGFASYLWKIDGAAATSTSNSYTVDTASLSPGVHNVMLSVKKADGSRYSARAVIRVEKE